MVDDETGKKSGDIMQSKNACPSRTSVCPPFVRFRLRPVSVERVNFQRRAAENRNHGEKEGEQTSFVTLPGHQLDAFHPNDFQTIILFCSSLKRSQSSMIRSTIANLILATFLVAGPAATTTAYVVQPSASSRIGSLSGRGSSFSASAVAPRVSDARYVSSQLSSGDMSMRLSVPSALRSFNKKFRGASSSAGPASTSRIGMSDAAAAAEPEEEKKSFLQKLKNIVPPANERKKLLPLALMFFCILFNYTILRDTKDVLMVTAPKSGAEVIPFIKTYVNLPTAIGFTAVYAKLCDKLEQKNVFYACTIPFLIFFGLFAWAIFPNTSWLHPHAFVDAVAGHLPAGFAAPLSIIRNWSYAVFYVMAEMWGSVVASLLFWGFANEVTTVDEAKKYYPLFGMGANVALIFSGQYVKWVSKMRANLPPGVDPWGVSLKYLMAAVVGCGALMTGIFSYMQNNVLTDPNCVDQEKRKNKAKKKKVKMGMRESAKFLMKSPYIRDLATLVISYGMCINIVEVSWKGKLKQAYPDPNAYSSFMGNFSSATGTVTLIMMLLGRTIFEKFGWRTAALVTPTTIGVTGLIFFALTIFSSTFAPLAATLGTSPLMLAVLVGAAQNILSKSSKYSLFDPCKEMAYIPLDQESKTKGKAAVDVIGNPLGKSGGSLIQQVMIFAVGSLAAATPYLAGILGVLIYFWFKAANSLGDQFEEAMEME